MKKAFDTVPRVVLWQVLEELGVCGRILDIIKSLYAHDSAAVRSLQGISAIFRCLMGVKQGCPLNPTLFGLYVDGLEKYLLETADIDAPALMGVMVPLLLYADDLTLMSESASGLQKQLDALASFCDQHQLTVNLSKVVVFEKQRSAMCDFRLNGAVVERVDRYKYLVFIFHVSCFMKFYKTLQPVRRYADYLSTIRCASNRRLISRFRRGCHGLQVDTIRWVKDVDVDRGCLVCYSPGCVEDEQHFIFDCPAYNHIRVKHMNLLQYCCTLADFLSLCEPKSGGGFLRDCFAYRKFKEILSV